MGQISILIVDDDFAKITSIIKQVREVFSETLDITQASSVQEAIENLQKKEFHLMITDFQMPLREGDAPDDNGGLALLKSLYKKKTAANLPLYIVGLTQFDSLKISYKGVWKVWHYSSELDEWRENIRDLIHHVYNGGHWARVYGDCGPVISGIIGPGSSGFITEVIGPAQGMNSAA